MKGSKGQTGSTSTPLCCTSAPATSAPAAAAAAAAEALSFTVLHSFFLTVVKLSELLPLGVIRDEDPESFKTLVRETVVCSLLPNAAEQLSAKRQESIHQMSKSNSLGEMGMKEVLDQVQSKLFTMHTRLRDKSKLLPGEWISATPRNILTLGYRPIGNFRDDRASGGQSTGAQRGGGFATTNFFTNTMVSALRSSSDWHLLLSRVGPEMLLKLFATPEVAVFTTLPNSCLLQISGTPVVDLRPRTRYLGKQANDKPNHFSSAVPGGPSLEQGQIGSKRKGAAQESSRRRAKRSRPSIRNRSKSKFQKNQPIQHVQCELPAIKAMEHGMPNHDNDSIPPAQKRVMMGPKPMALRSFVSAPQLDQRSESSAPVHRRPLLRPLQSLSNLADTRHPIERRARTESTDTPLVDPADLRPLKKQRLSPKMLKPNEVLFNRSKIYHARPSISLRGKMVYGLSSGHVLSRLPQIFPCPLPRLPFKNSLPKKIRDDRSRHLLKYIFPKQFGLRNTFVLPLASSEDLSTLLHKGTNTGIPNNFENREADIERLGNVKTPKQLKGVILSLVGKMIHLHEVSKLRTLLDQHCPRTVCLETDIDDEVNKSVILDLMSVDPKTQYSLSDISLEVSDASKIVPHGASAAKASVKAKPRFFDYAQKPHQVELYVHAVIKRVIPNGFWGCDKNKRLILDNVSAFLRLRRFESMTLNTLLQGFLITECDWLRPSSASYARCKSERPNAQQMNKRKELLQEFLYWFMDGFVMNVIKTAFNMTHSSTHQNRSLFFRHDDWKTISQPLLRKLKETMFEKIPREQVLGIVQERKLGYSYIRLLPKETGVRPIANLGRRPVVKGLKGLPELGRSINNILENVLQVIRFERDRNSNLLGSAVSNPMDIYVKLKQFKDRLSVNYQLPKLYFVKVDVRACFDTIQQEKLLSIVADILQEEEYRIQKYGKVMPASGRIWKRFVNEAGPDDSWHFPDVARRVSNALHCAILSDKVVYPSESREDVLALLKEHITSNTVKIGKHYYRQKDGIPQGSVLSSILCALFYGHMEKTSLPFTKDPFSVMFRYIDDFLFITTKKDLAIQFLRIMDRGHAEYGCYVSTEKGLTNFDISVNGVESMIAVSEDADFPWCGNVINTKTLDVKADLGRRESVEMADTLSVQRNVKPGQAFLAKMLQASQVRGLPLYNDTKHNSPMTVYTNIYQSHLVTAWKYHAYVREWKGDIRRRPALFIRVIHSVIKFSFSNLEKAIRRSTVAKIDARCDLRQRWIVWLGYHAFLRVMSRRPSHYSGPILDMLEREVRDPASQRIRQRLTKIVENPVNDFIERPSWKR